MTSRRSHKKSRNGCVQCKQRRVKCDEANPCVNCARRHLSCTYTLRRTPRPLEYAAVDEDARSAASTPEASARTGNILDSLQSKVASGSFLPRDWDAQDFELMHHYCISTALTMSPQERVRNVWAAEIPKIAYSYEFLMHGILSLAAMHLAFVKPEKCSHCQTKSTFHMALGLQTFRKILQSPTEENCCALFSFSSIIMVWICAAPAEPEDTQAIEHTVDLFNLCRGIMALKEFMPIVRNSPLHPLLSPDYAPKSDEILNDIHLHRFAGLDDQIYHLRHQLASEPLNQTDKSVYDQAIYQLERSCRSIERAEAPAQCGMVFLWPLSVLDGFVGLVERRQPLALVLLGYYCTHLYSFRQFWFVEKRAIALLHGVSTAIPLEYAHLLEWPTRFCSYSLPNR